jgi:FkbM family methyltransferase
MRPLLRHDDLVLDVGAHVGCFAIAMARQCRLVYALEAQRVLHELLVRNARQSGVANVVALNVAIGARAGYARLKSDLLDGTNRILAYDTLQPTNYGGVAIETAVERTDLRMATIDSFGLAPFLIKIDVEGFEDFVVAGALATIENCKPVIVYERNFKHERSSEVANLEVALAAKYDRPWRIGEGSDYVLYPLHPLNVPGQLTDHLGSKIAVADRDVWISNNGRVRGPFRLFTPRIDHVRIHLPDIARVVDGVVTGRSIRWSNGTIWTTSGSAGSHRQVGQSAIVSEVSRRRPAMS